MKRNATGVFVVAILAVLQPRAASATYITFTNLWTSPITHAGVCIQLDRTTAFSQLYGCDFQVAPAYYGLTLPAPGDGFLIDVGPSNPIMPGETFTTPLIPQLPDAGGYYLADIGVGGDGWWSGGAPSPWPGVVSPGSTFYQLWPLPAAPYYQPIVQVTFHPGAPATVPEPSSLVLLSIGLAGAALKRKRRS